MENKANMKISSASPDFRLYQISARRVGAIKWAREAGYACNKAPEGMDLSPLPSLFEEHESILSEAAKETRRLPGYDRGTDRLEFAAFLGIGLMAGSLVLFAGTQATKFASNEEAIVHEFSNRAQTQNKGSTNWSVWMPQAGIRELGRAAVPRS
jgi:hypothetical protein